MLFVFPKYYLCFQKLPEKARISFLAPREYLYLPFKQNTNKVLNESKLISASNNLPTKPHSLLTRNEAKGFLF